MNDNPYGSKTIEEATDEAIEYIKKRKSGEIKRFSLVNGGNYYAVGRGGTITGRGAQHIG